MGGAVAGRQATDRAGDAEFAEGELDDGPQPDPQPGDDRQGLCGLEKGFSQEGFPLCAQAEQASTGEEKARVEERLNGLVRNLSALAENYPAPRADVTFQQLQRTLQEVENSIEQGRRFYHAATRKYKFLSHNFPADLVGRRFGFTSPPARFSKVAAATKSVSIPT